MTDASNKFGHNYKLQYDKLNKEIDIMLRKMRVGIY